MERQEGVFEVYSKEWNLLEAVANILTAICTNGYKFSVRTVYLDFGANLKWTTIIAEKGESSYQALTVTQHTLITTDVSWERFQKAIDNILQEAKKYQLATF